MFNLLSVICSLLLSSLLSQASELVVWNVGQGQWVTEIHSHDCLHFDMGGEKNPGVAVWKACGQKENWVHLSHWDWDHISFLRTAPSHLSSLCLIRPTTPAPSETKKYLVKNLRSCFEESPFLGKIFRVLYSPSPRAQGNEASEVVYSRTFQTVIPGDSPKKQEQLWAETSPPETVGLILGHHGSRTSTSEALLRALPHLRWAVATARRSRYGHPHREIVEALKKEKVPLLLTEDWGHLHFLKND